MYSPIFQLVQICVQIQVPFLRLYEYLLQKENICMGRGYELRLNVTCGSNFNKMFFFLRYYCAVMASLWLKLPQLLTRNDCFDILPNLVNFIPCVGVI